MASVLENLTIHYENMESTLKDSDSGVVFTDEELVGKFDSFPFVQLLRKDYSYE